MQLVTTVVRDILAVWASSKQGSNVWDIGTRTRKHAKIVATVVQIAHTLVALASI